MKIKRFRGLVALAVLTFPLTTRADVKLPAVFGEHMVLQRDRAVPVFGWAEPGEEVKVTAGTASASAKAGPDGKWTVRLPALKASAAPIELVAAGASNRVVIKDVLIGDVWICSGQSNMAFVLKESTNGPEELSKANHPEIRFFMVPRAVALEPQTDCKGKWSVCTPETAPGVSAVGYHFVKEIAETQKVPVGMINDSVGATPGQSWTSLTALEADPDLKKAYAKPFADLVANPDATKKAHDEWLAQGGKEYGDAMKKYYGEAYVAKQKGLPEPERPKPPTQPEPPHLDDAMLPTVLYNGMIAPLMPFAIKGVTWYQGESNGSQGELYQKLLPALITSWRTPWGQGNFPFLIVQLPNYRPRQAQPVEGGWARLREAQRMTAESVPDTGLAVTIDVGEGGNLHPPNKAPVGHRLALIARQKVYGEDIVSSGPMYESHKLAGNKVLITFKQPGKGLKSTGEVKGFALAGADNKFVWAQAKIEGPNTVSVWSDDIKAPATLWYGWADNPEVTLYNSADLPACPFRLTLNANP